MSAHGITARQSGSRRVSSVLVPTVHGKRVAAYVSAAPRQSCSRHTSCPQHVFVRYVPPKRSRCPEIKVAFVRKERWRLPVWRVEDVGVCFRRDVGAVVIQLVPSKAGVLSSGTPIEVKLVGIFVLPERVVAVLVLVWANQVKWIFWVGWVFVLWIVDPLPRP